MNHQFSTSGDGRGGVGLMNTHLYYQKIDFVRDRQYWEFQQSHNHCVLYPVA